MTDKKLFLYPREFNKLVEMGLLDSKYLINVDISEEKDALQNKLDKAIEKLEFLGDINNYSSALEDYGVLEWEECPDAYDLGRYARQALKEIQGSV